MNKHLKVVFAVVAVLTMVLSACGQAATEVPTEVPTEAPAEATEAPVEKIKVAVAFPGVITDQSWNQFGYEGLQRAAEECGVEIAYSEDVFPDEQVEVFRNYAAEGYDVIIGHGGEYADAIAQVAAEYPDLWFGDTNGLPEGDNVSIMIIGYNEMSFLAGVLACEMTETDHVAVVGAMEIPVMAAAFDSFVEGVNYCGKEIEVDEVYTGDWADVTLAREAALALIADGADVIYHHLDAADAGAIAAAEDEGVYAIGLYRDSSDLGPGAVIGSAIGFPGDMIYRLACGMVPQGEKQWLNVDTGVDIHMTDLTPPDVQARLREVVEMIKSGELDIKMFGEEAPAEAPVEEEKLKVAVAFPGVVSDQSWNQFGYEGLQRAAEECGVEIAYSEDVFPDEQVEVFRNYAAEGYDVIIGHGGEYADAIAQVAAEYPDLWFGDTNGLPEGDNVSIMIIGYNEMSFLAGVLACEMTETDHVAVVGAMEIPVMAAAFDSFVEGVNYCGKEIEVDEVYTGDWADVTLAREAALALIADGADVIYHHLDAADAGAIAAAEDEGVYAIGLYRDSSDLGPGAVIGSAIGFPGDMIYRLACGMVPQGEKQWLNVDTGVDIHMTDLTPPDVQARLREVVEMIKSGEIEIKMFGQ